MLAAGPETESRRRLIEMLAQPDPAIDLAEAALLVACEEYPQLDIEAYRARLDELGREARRRAIGLTAAEGVRVVNRLLFVELGFSGNERDYYDPRNSFLNEVLDRRTGIPITLSTVFVEVARRAGLPAFGVGLPGHFIVKVALPGEDWLLDPYSGGARLSPADCQRRLDRIFDGKLRMAPEMLLPCGPRQMLERLLQNLKAIYIRKQDFERALGAVALLRHVAPENAEELRDRGLLYAALDCYGLAVSDLEAYLERAPRAEEARELREKVEYLRERAARVN
jgi:regulator of sirC expression with transglutaminase-like and TPR domain